MPRPLTVKIKRLDPANADVPLPAKMSAHAAGFDVCAAVPAPLVIEPGKIALIPCGFAMAIPEGYEAQVRPRSGLASKSGVTVVNTPGTIDSDYRGEVQVPMINLGPKNFAVTRGMRIAQMLILPVPRVRMVEVDNLGETRRGRGGFGHTGH